MVSHNMKHNPHKILKTCFDKNPSTFDPRKCGDTISSTVIFLLFKGLTKLQPNRQVVLDLAESYSISHYGKRYVFHIGEHYWSDGTRISAYDFERSWKQTLSPDFHTFSAHLFYPIKNAAKAKRGEISTDKVGVHAESATQLRVELQDHVPHFLELVSFCSYFPIPSHAKKQFCSLPDKSFVSSGPFELAKWRPGKELLLKKNPLASHGRSGDLDFIHIQIIPNEKQAYSYFEKKKLDWIGEPFSPFPINHLPSLSKKWECQPIGGITLCFFNTRVFPFTHPKIRQAFSIAVQREKILSRLSIPHAQPATGLVPPILKGNAKTAFFPDGDIWLAKELFEKGVKELKISPKKLDICLSFEASENGLQMAKYLKSCWEETFFIKVNLEPLEFKAFYDRLSKQQHMLSLTQWMAQYNSPMNILERFRDLQSGKNFSNWYNQEFKRVLDCYFKQKTLEKQHSIIEQAETILFKDMPIIPIYYFSYSYLKHPHLENLLFSPIGRVYLEEARINPKLADSNEEGSFEPISRIV